jgi:Ca-activated chloride channel family protein
VTLRGGYMAIRVAARCSSGRFTAVLSLVATACLASLAGPGIAAGPSSSLVLVLDVSGSMRGKVGGETKILGARRVLGKLIEDLPDGRPVGLFAYGHRRADDCTDIEQVAPLAPLDRKALRGAIEKLQPKGKTPITGALVAAIRALDGQSAGGTVVVVTDGLETCSGDPCAAVRAARAKNSGFVLHVIGLDVSKEDVSSLECAAQAGGGLYLAAADAGELSAALSKAVVPPVQADGVLSIKAVADGSLEDVSIRVIDASGKNIVSARSYRDPATNPRVLPLPAGVYQVEAKAVRVSGADVQRLTVEIVRGSKIEREIDLSTGELLIGVTRNGRLSDASFSIYPAGSRKAVASGRTYRAASSNPATKRLVAGEYEVELNSVEIEGDAKASLGKVTVPPRGRVRLDHAFVSGSLALAVTRGNRLVDSTVAVHGPAGEVARGRTYDKASTNPKRFELSPGNYRVDINEIKGARREINVTVTPDISVEQTVDLDKD